MLTNSLLNSTRRVLPILFFCIAASAFNNIRAEKLNTSNQQSPSCCFHIRLLTDEGIKRLNVLLDIMKDEKKIKFVPVININGVYAQELWQEHFEGWITPFAQIDNWLCEQNTHVCSRDDKNQENKWTLQSAPDQDNELVTSIECGNNLPKYVVCLPDIKISTYQETLVRRINRATENLPTIVIKFLRGCKSWDKDCQRLVHNLNVTRPQAVAPNNAVYEGEVRLPYSALSVELPIDANQTAEQQTLAAKNLFTRFIQKANLEEQKGTYAVLTDDRTINITNQFTPTAISSLKEGQEIEDSVKEIVSYPYKNQKERIYRDNLSPVVVGVWDKFVDDKHCNFLTKEKSAIAYPDSVTGDRIVAGGKYYGRQATANSCSEIKSNLDDEIDHGTAVAGVIAAQPIPNSAWMGGLNPNSRVWAVNLEDLLQTMRNDSAAPVLDFVKKNETPISVINISEISKKLYSQTASQFDRLLFGDSDANGVLKQRLVSDLVFTIAAGNDGKLYDKNSPCQLYPACPGTAVTDQTGLITVTASNLTGDDILRCKDLKKNGLSLPSDIDCENDDNPVVNYGDRFDVAAPGIAFTPVYGNYFGVQAGSSFSAPRVAALASLLIASASQKAPDGIGHPPPAPDVRLRILSTADPIIGNNDTAYTLFGIVNFDKALAYKYNVVEYKNPDAQCDACGRKDFKPSKSAELEFSLGIDAAKPGQRDKKPWSRIVRLHSLVPDDIDSKVYELRWIDPSTSNKGLSIRSENITVDTKQMAEFTSGKKGRWKFKVTDIKEYISCAFHPDCPSVITQ